MKSFLVILLIFCTINSKAQLINKKSQNIIFVELGKAGILFNAGYDYQFRKRPYGVKVTIGSNFAAYKEAFQVGTGFYYLKGKKRHFLELGVDLSYFQYSQISDDQISFTLLSIDEFTNTLYANFNIGYRYSGKATIFKIGISPGIMNIGFVSGGYIGVGIKL